MTFRVCSQLIVASLLQNAAISQHVEDVAVADSAKPMSDDDGSTTFHGSIQGLLDYLLTLLIKSRSSFIEDQDTRVLDEGPRDSNSLLLTT